MRRLLLSSMVAIVALATPASAGDAPPMCAGVDVNDFRATDGPDFFTGSLDRDVIAAGDGSDQIFVGGGEDVVCGNTGSDVLGGEDGSDELYGNDGADIIVGHGGADYLTAGEGVDRIDGGTGGDTLQAIAPDAQRDDIYDGMGIDVISGNAEDVWHRCEDQMPDDRTEFNGTVVLDPDC